MAQRSPSREADKGACFNEEDNTFRQKCLRGAVIVFEQLAKPFAATDRPIHGSS